MDRRKPLLTAKQVAESLQVRTETVREWVRQGRIIPTAKTPGGQLRFDLHDVLRQLQVPRARGSDDTE